MTIVDRPLVPGAGPRPITSAADVAARLPRLLAEPVLDPIRDALVEALTSMLIEWEYRVDYAAAQSDPARAVRQYLTALSKDRSFGRARGEEDEAYRERAQRSQSVIEQAVAAGVNVILAPFTNLQCQLVDRVLDGWFLHDGTDGAGNPATWHSFIGSSPHYPERFYTDGLVDNGYARESAVVGGARPIGDTIGRLLLVRLPNLGFQLRSTAIVSAEGTAPTDGFFVGDNLAPPGGAFLDASDLGADAVYGAIANFLNLTVGESVRWEILSDIEA